VNEEDRNKSPFDEPGVMTYSEIRVEEYSLDELNMVGSVENHRNRSERMKNVT
jgi:hypothetical protein